MAKINFSVFPEMNIVYFRFARTSSVDGFQEAFARYCADPDYSALQIRLLDLSRIEVAEFEMPQIFSTQQRVHATLPNAEKQVQTVIYAVTDFQLDLAKTITNLWNPFGNVRVDVAKTVPQVLQFIDTDNSTIIDLLTGWAPIN